MSGERSGPELRSDARENERRILRVAARLLAEDPNASVKAVAEAAGVSRLTVYRRFDGRDALVAAIVERASTEIEECLRRAAEAEEPAADSLRRLMRDLTGVAADYLLLGHVGAPPGPPTAALIERADEAFLKLVRRGERDGSFRPGLLAADLAHFLFAGLGATLRSAELAGRDLVETGERVAAMLVDGVAARPPREVGSPSGEAGRRR